MKKEVKPDFHLVVENRRYTEDVEEQSKEDLINDEKVEKYDNHINSLTEKELENLVNEITNKIIEENILSDLKSDFIPEKKNKKDSNNLSVTISLPSEVQSSACIIEF